MAQSLKRMLDDRYEITRQILCCGETVVYLGRDVVSQRMVTIKEFFAEAIMRRDAAGRAEILPGCDVQYKSLSSDFEELYNYLMRLPEDFLIMRPVGILWRNNTVYVIERYVETETLDDFLARREQPLGWSQLKRMITPLVKLMGRMHADGVYHRGISPETLLVDSANNLLLSGFSIPAARTADSEIAATLYFGYSAPEQYASNSWQGCWSDVYSLAAVCYRALTGITPVEWRQRGEGRDLVVPSQVKPEIPQNVSDALLKALSVDLRSRYRTVEEFWCDLLVAQGQGTVTYQLPVVRRGDEPLATLQPAIRGSNARPLLLALAMISLVAIFALLLAYRLVDTYFQPIVSSSQSAESSETAVAGEDTQPKIVVPDLVGVSIEKVLPDPLYQRLFTFDIEWIYSEARVAGDIVAQQPKAGADPGESSHIYIWVSKGSERISMPDVLGKTLSEATTILNSLDIGYRAELVEPEADQQDVESGTVVNASILTGNNIYRNTDRVVLYVVQRTESNPESAESSQPSRNDNVISVPRRTESFWPNPGASAETSDFED